MEFQLQELLFRWIALFRQLRMDGSHVAVAQP